MSRATLVLLLALWACGNDREPDAYGNFEATEVVVSAETSGRIIEFSPVEGMPLSRGAVVAVIDTTQLALERQQVQAQREATGSRGDEVSAQMRVLVAQQEVARRTYERTQRLHAQQAATTQQLDQAERDLR
ncbi:MAG: HlyD family secretion protein, partial [Gemmatimonadaceae bacterium]